MAQGGHEVVVRWLKVDMRWLLGGLEVVVRWLKVEL